MISNKWSDTAIIAISADDSVTSIASCLEKGVILDYIVKPMVEKEVTSLYRYFLFSFFTSVSFTLPPARPSCSYPFLVLPLPTGTSSSIAAVLLEQGLRHKRYML